MFRERRERKRVQCKTTDAIHKGILNNPILGQTNKQVRLEGATSRH
jgi:hypothetical protein